MNVINSSTAYGAQFPRKRLAEILGEHMPALSVSGFPAAAHPIALPKPQYSELLDATGRLLALELEAVKRLAADHAGRLEALKANPEEFPRPFRDEDYEMRHAADMARADVIIGPHGPRFIEFNVGGGFGGMVQFETQRRIWQQVGAECGEAQLTGTDPFLSLANLISRTSAELGRCHPAALFLYSGGDSGRTEPQLRSQVRYLREHGVQAENADFRYLTASDVSSELEEPLGIFQFSEREALDEGWELSALLRLLDSGFAGLPPQSCRFVDSKKIMGLLSEGLPWMTEGDHALVRRYIPWTRIMRDHTAHWRGRKGHLQDILNQEQENFVLKGASSLGGKEVIFGHECSADQWQRLVASAIETEYFVAQEVVESVRVPVDVIHDEDGNSETISAQLIVKPFSIGGVASGCRARVDSATKSRVVSLETGSAAACVLGSPF
jgi:hypothetical protein